MGREGKVLKGPQNTQILTVMRDSGSFSGQRQQMAFTREKGVKRGKEGCRTVKWVERSGGRELSKWVHQCESIVRCCVSIVGSID